MSEKEMEIAIRIAEAIKILPAEKKERWIGYAEGVVDMANRCLESKSEGDINPNT